MRAIVTGIKVKDSYRQGTFRYIFFKELNYKGKEKKGETSYRTCVGAEFRNYDNWALVRTGMILDNLQTIGKLVDADSDFQIQGINKVTADPNKCWVVQVISNNYKIYVGEYRDELIQENDPVLYTEEKAQEVKKRWDEFCEPAGEIIKIG